MIIDFLLFAVISQRVGFLLATTYDMMKGCVSNDVHNDVDFKDRWCTLWYLHRKWCKCGDSVMQRKRCGDMVTMVRYNFVRVLGALDTYRHAGL